MEHYFIAYVAAIVIIVTRELYVNHRKRNKEITGKG